MNLNDVNYRIKSDMHLLFYFFVYNSSLFIQILKIPLRVHFNIVLLRFFVPQSIPMVEFCIFDKCFCHDELKAYVLYVIIFIKTNFYRRICIVWKSHSFNTQFAWYCSNYLFIWHIWGSFATVTNDINFERPISTLENWKYPGKKKPNFLSNTIFNLVFQLILDMNDA